MRVELMVLVICKTLRQNERVYLEFSVFLFVLQVFLFVSFCFGTILYLQSNQFVMIKLALISNGGKKQKNKPVSSWPKVQYSVREKKDFTQFLKSPKSPSPEFSWLMPWQKKTILLVVTKDQLLLMVLQ